MLKVVDMFDEVWTLMQSGEPHFRILIEGEDSVATL